MVSYEVNFEARPSYDFFIFAQLSRDLIKQANNDELVKYYLVTGIIHTAFAFESMINHYGNILCEQWDDQVKRQGRKGTDKILFNAAGLPGFMGNNTYQEIESFFNMRNFFAHAKTAVEKTNVSIDDGSTESRQVDKLHSISHSKIQKLNINDLSRFIDLVERAQDEIEESAIYPKWHSYAGQKMMECPLGSSGLRCSKKI